MQLDSCYLFQKLSHSQIEQIAAITREKQIQKGQWLFHEGQKATHIYLVKAGAVELVINVEDTIEIPIAVIRPNDGCLGIGALLEPYQYSLSARAQPFQGSTFTFFYLQLAWQLKHEAFWDPFCALRPVS